MEAFVMSVPVTTSDTNALEKWTALVYQYGAPDTDPPLYSAGIYAARHEARAECLDWCRAHNLPVR